MDISEYRQVQVSHELLNIFRTTTTTAARTTEQAEM